MPSHVTADWTRSLIRAVIRTAHLTYSASTTRSSATCSSWTSWKLLARLMQFSMISGVTMRYVILYRNIDGEMDRELAAARDAGFFVTDSRMLRRCYTKHNAGYKDYGGRGIRVCTAWRGSLAVFL